MNNFLLPTFSAFRSSQGKWVSLYEAGTESDMEKGEFRFESGRGSVLVKFPEFNSFGYGSNSPNSPNASRSVRPELVRVSFDIRRCVRFTDDYRLLNYVK